MSTAVKWALHFIQGLLALVLVGCGSLRDPTMVKPPSEEEAKRVRDALNTITPVTVVSKPDALLRWLGQTIEQSQASAVLIGQNCGIGDKGSAVDLAWACRIALGQVAAKAPSVIVLTSSLNAPSAGQAAGPLPHPIAPAIHIDPGRVVKGTRLMLPDVQLDGAAMALHGGHSVNDSEAVNAAIAELSRSKSYAFSTVMFGFAIRERATGREKVSGIRIVSTTWDASAGLEGGVLVSARVDDKKRSLGLRKTRTRTATDNTPEAHYEVVALAVAQLLAELWGIDLAQCPCAQPSDPGALAARARTPLGILQTLDQATLQSLTESRRTELAVAALRRLEYLKAVDAGDTAAQRNALARFRADHGLLQDMKRQPAPSVDDVAALRIALWGLSDDEGAALPRHGGLRVTTFNQVMQLEKGATLSALVSSPVAGHLTCAYRSGANEWSLTTPYGHDDKADYITTRSSVAVPRDRGGGPEPRLDLTEPGQHLLLCVLSSKSLAPLLPKQYSQRGTTFSGSLDEVRAALAQAIGDAYITDGLLSVEVTEPPPPPKKVPDAKRVPPVAQRRPKLASCSCEMKPAGGMRCTASSDGKSAQTACPMVLLLGVVSPASAALAATPGSSPASASRRKGG